MKKNVLLFAMALILSQLSFAQNIGIGNTNPQAKLDVSGDFILRSYSLTMADGTTYALDVNTNKFSNYKLTGPTGNFQIAGITAAAHDRNITLYNRTGNSMEIYNDDINAVASNRILTGTGTTFAVYNGGTVSLRYDTAIQKWEVISSHYNNLDYFGSGSNWDMNGTSIFNNNSGNVGVGTNTPDAKLTVNGNIALLSDTVKVGCGIFPSNMIIDNIAKPRSVFHIINDGCVTFMPPNIVGLSGGTDGKIVTLITHLNNTLLRHLQGASPVPSASDSMNMIELFEPNSNGNLNQPSSYSFNAGGSVTLIYDGIRNRWKILSYNGDVKTTPPLPYATHDTSLISGYNFSSGTEAVLPAVRTLGGNSQILANGDDVTSGNIALPFTIVLGGKTYSNFAVSANGIMQLVTAANITPNLTGASTNSITSLNYNAKLAPLWDDLILKNDISNQGGVWSVTTGIAPNREFHVEWIGTFYNQSATNNIRFRIILYETSNEIKFHYSQTVNPLAPGNGGFTTGLTTNGIDFSNVNTTANTATGTIAYDSNYSAPAAGMFYVWSPAITSENYLQVSGNLDINGFIETESVTAPVLLNGWSNYGSGYKAAGYYKDKERIVHLSGMLNNSAPAGTVLFNLPISYRPAGGSLIVMAPNTVTGFTQITVNSNGNVTCGPNAVPGFISLDGISFRSN